MYFIDLQSPFRYNLTMLLESCSFYNGGNFMLLLLVNSLTSLRSYLYSFTTSSASIIIVFYDLTFLVFILKLAEGSISLATKHTVFLPVS